MIRWVRQSCQFLKKKIVRKVCILLVVAIVFACLAIYFGIQKDIDYFNYITYEDTVLEPNKITSVASDISIPDFTPVAKQEGLILFVNPKTANFAVYDDKTKQISYTAMIDTELNQYADASQQQKKQMQSQFVLKMVDKKLGTESELYPVDTALENNTFSIITSGNKVNVKYLIGELEKEYQLPIVLSQKRFEELSEISSSVKRNLGNVYSEVDYRNTTSSAYKTMVDEVFPMAKDEIIYVFKPFTKPYFEQGKYRSVAEYIITDLEQALKDNGYTEEQKAIDEAEYDYNPSKAEMDAVVLELEYALTPDGLTVSMDKSKIKHGQRSIPSEITLLPYFLSADNQRTGYILLPDGSGSIMNLNNQKYDQPTYSVPIYGYENISVPEISFEKTINAYLPVFGLKTDQKVIFGHVTSGQALTRVNADVSGGDSRLNYVNTSFSLRESKKEIAYRGYQNMAGTYTVTRIQSGYSEGMISVDYHFLEQSDDYVDMAQAYQKCLLENNKLNQNQNPPDLLVTYLGSADRIKSVAGVPVVVNEAMTTFQQMAEISQGLYAENVSHSIKVLGALNGGMQSYLEESVDFESSVGGSSGYRKMKEIISEYGANVYLDYSTTQANENKLLDYFNRNEMGIKNISNKHANAWDWDPISLYYLNNERFLLSPSYFADFASLFGKNLAAKNVTGLSLKYEGLYLNADKSKKSPVMRDAAEQDMIEMMQTFKENKVSLLNNGANEYVLSTSDVLADISSGSNLYTITDRSVPFLQIALHGYIPYCYSSINMQEDTRQALLKTIETGAFMQFTLSYQNTSVLKQSNHTEFYSCTYDDNLKKLITDYYGEAADLIQTVADRKISDHKMLAQDVFLTSYESGPQVLVNYSTENFEYNGQTVLPQDFLVLAQ